MKYGGVKIYPQLGTLIYKDSKEVVFLDYPRLNKSEAQLMRLLPTKLMCVLKITTQEHLIALKQMDRTNAEHDLHIDKYGIEAHYYKRVILDLGEEQQVPDAPGGLILVPATFTALDPYLYDTSTNEVVY